MAQLVKNLPATQETWVQSLGWEDPLEKGKATYSRILAWRIPWTVYHGVTKSWTQLSNFYLSLYVKLFLQAFAPTLCNRYSYFHFTDFLKTED